MQNGKQLVLTVSELTQGREVTAIWRVKGWSRNFRVLHSVATFSLDIGPPGATVQSRRCISFFFQKNPVVSRIRSPIYYDYMETTEWLSLYATLHSGTPPCAFILTIEKLSPDYNVVQTLLPATQIIIKASRVNTPEPQLVKANFIPWRTYRHHTQAQRFLPPTPIDDELRLQFTVVPLSVMEDTIAPGASFAQQFVQDVWNLVLANDLFMDISLEAADGAQLGGHKVILAARSPYLKELMSKENTKTKVKVEGVNSKPLTVIVTWIYTGIVSEEDLRKSYMKEVIQAAKMLQLPDLVEMLDKKNVSRLLEIADKEKLAQDATTDATGKAETDLQVPEEPPIDWSQMQLGPCRRKKKGQGRPECSLCCLGLNNPIRKLCYAITEWKIFEYFILVTILATCYTLAAATPYSHDDSDHFNNQIEEYEIVFTVVFTAECFMNIIAQGLIVHDGAYLRQGVWNILDFVIVFVGLLGPVLTIFIPGLDLKALRAFRVLRPLKLASKVPALQVVINSIMMALIPLFNIAILVVFVMAIYAIIGLQMFEGQLHNTCFHNLTGDMMESPCNCGGNYHCEDMEFYECRPYWDGPNDGITNFDNIGLSMLTVYQCISLEGWTDVMYNLQDGMGAGWEWIYFVSMVFFGAFFTMNLILGVLSGEFSKQKEKVESRFEYLKQKELTQIEGGMTGYLNWITASTNKVKSSDPPAENENVPSGEGEQILAPEGQEEKQAPTGWKATYESFKRANQPMRHVVRAIVTTQLVYWIVIILVMLNTVVLATEHYRQPQWLEDFQENANMVFICLFTLEVVMKMYGFGLPKYFVSLFNRFDFFATVISLVEVSFVKTGFMPQIGMSVLRCVRLLRLFKLTHYWPAMKSLAKGILSSLEAIASLLVLLYLFIMIFSMLGMQVFGGKFMSGTTDFPPRTNFDSFSTAMLTVFQIMTGEDWNEVMYLGIAAMGGVGSTGVILAAVYFLVLFTFGNYILLNVFLAIAVDNLEPAEVEKEEEGAGPPEEGAAVEGGTEGEATTAEAKKDEATAEVKKDEAPAADAPADTEAAAAPEEPPADPPCPPIPEGSSFFILSQTNPIRVLCHNILCNGIVGTFLLICILISSGCLAAEDPVYEDSPRNLMLEKIDYFFSAVFTIELTLKLIVYGIIFHQGAFCRSPANLLDLVVVGVSLISFFSTSGAVETIKILRVCRVLRPLRAINRAKGLKRVIQCMIVAIKTIGNIVIVTTLLEFMYGVMGVQLFKGGLFQCTDPSKHVEEECKGQFFTYDKGGGRPLLHDREWINSPFNFDSVPKGMATLFAVSTFEGWPQMLYKCIDSAGEDMGPVFNNRLLVAFYYISYLVIISFYMINIFVGFVILTFQTEGEQEYAHCDLEKNQRDCMEYALKAVPVVKYIPTNPLQAQIWAIVSSPTFDNISLLLVCLNTVSLGANFYKQPDWYTEKLVYVNYFFTAAFSIEFVLKLVSMGVRVYCKDAWNVFDFLIVAGSYVDIIFADVNISFFRLFRAGRLIKLLNKSEGLRTILWTFIRSLQALPYVICLILLLFFIYSIVGMQSFGKIALDESTQIHRNNNFQNFGNTLILLFRCATGEAWQDIMMDCIKAPHVKCFLQTEGAPEDESCGSDVAYPYFISFFVNCAFLVLNLLVAVIMDNFDYLTRDWSILGAHHLGEFVQMWSEYDPEATGKMKHENLLDLFRNISPPLGIGTLCPRSIASKQLVAMNMPMDDDGTVNFNATLFALVRARLYIRTDGSLRETNSELRATILALWGNTDLAILDRVVPAPEVLNEVSTVGKFHACILIQRKFRRMRNKSKKAIVQKTEVETAAEYMK